ncbi:nucleotidyltransferase domain-containing protein [Patescibacteria group bacterium]|nr:nucleotidyltransferase domain-containing protein [Patescibacteria group bacterium]
MNSDIQIYINKLVNNPKILGVIMFGSYARGDNRKDSDIDLIVFISKGNVSRKVVERKGKTFEMIWSTPSDSLNYWKHDLDGCHNIWTDAQILFDRDNTVRKLQDECLKLISKGKEKLADWNIQHREFDAKDQINAIKNLGIKDQSAANYALHILVGKLVELFFDMNLFWKPPAKKQIQYIREVNKEFASLLDQFYLPLNDFDALLTLANKI